MLAYTGAPIVLTAQYFIYKQFLQLNTNLFNAKNKDREVVITFLATVLLVRFSKDVLTAFLPSELEIFVHKYTKEILNSYLVFFLFCCFFGKGYLYLSYKTVFVEPMVEVDNLHTLTCITVNRTNCWSSRITFFMYFRLNIEARSSNVKQL